MPVEYAGNDYLLGRVLYYQDKLAVAQANGCPDLITYLIEAYAQSQSTYWVARSLGITPFAARYRLKRICKLRKQGGDNRWT